MQLFFSPLSTISAVLITLVAWPAMAQSHHDNHEKVNQFLRSSGWEGEVLIDDYRYEDVEHQKLMARESSERRAFSMQELWEKGPNSTEARFSGYTLVQVESTTERGLSPTVVRAVNNLLSGAEAAYIDAHKEGGRLAGGESLLNNLSQTPDRFIDGRSTYAIIVRASAEQIVSILEAGVFPKDRVAASLRVSKASFQFPKLPVFMNLGRTPRDLPEKLSTKHLREGHRSSYLSLTSPQFPHLTPELFEHEIKFKHGIAIGGANEIKAFMIRKLAGQRHRDWMPIMLHTLESQNGVSWSGYRLDMATGKVVLEGDPQIERWQKSPEGNKGLGAAQRGFNGHEYAPHARFGMIFAERHYAEVVIPTEAYQAYLKGGPAPGLIEMYLGMGFTIEADLIERHPSFPKLTVVTMKITHENWIKLVASTESRRGFSRLRSTIEVHRPFSLLRDLLSPKTRAKIRCLSAGL